VKIVKDSLFEAPLLLWLFSPALGVLVAAPLVAGHIAARLLIARMRRRPRAVASTSRSVPRLQAANVAAAITASAG
jgi:hypothetical protein